MPTRRLIHKISKHTRRDATFRPTRTIKNCLVTYCIDNPAMLCDSNGQRYTASTTQESETAEQISIACAFQTQVSVGQSSSSTSKHEPSKQEKSYAATVYAEAGGQNKCTKQAVAHVMNNRIGTRSSWTDIEAVISASGQFNGYNSPMYRSAMDYYNNGVCNNSISQASMNECMEVIIPIYSGAESDITGGALYFHSFANPNDWAYHDSYTQVYVSGTEKFWFYK